VPVPLTYSLFLETRSIISMFMTSACLIRNIERFA
jgi:hypothetical protein